MQAHKYPRRIKTSNVDGGVGTRPMESKTFKKFPNTNNTKWYLTKVQNHAIYLRKNTLS